MTHICVIDGNDVSLVNHEFKDCKNVVNLHQIFAVAQWLRHCATNRKVAGSIPDGVIGIFH